MTKHKVSRVLLFGATGLVGQSALKQLIADSDIQNISVLARRSLPDHLKSSKVSEFIVDFNHLDENADYFNVDALICTMGTTIKVAGSQEKFREVDYVYPMNVARLARKRGVERFSIVSALGANANSSVFYNRIKGELERDLAQLGFSDLTILRPSVLVGEHAEQRPFEKIAQSIGKIFPTKWRSIPGDTVARVLVKSLKLNPSQKRIIENAEIFSF